jgi:hypothetical protein
MAKVYDRDAMQEKNSVLRQQRQYQAKVLRQLAQGQQPTAQPPGS